MAADINTAVQAAIGGSAVSQILEGDRRFDFVVRYLPQYRQNVDEMRNILLPTADGSRVPLGEVANIGFREGAFMIYRENGRRYIPLKFSVRGRDLAGTIADVQQRLQQSVLLPSGYHFEWAGGGRIAGRTAVGRVTVAGLRMNDPDMVELRSLLAELGLFPEAG